MLLVVEIYQKLPAATVGIQRGNIRSTEIRSASHCAMMQLQFWTVGSAKDREKLLGAKQKHKDIQSAHFILTGTLELQKFAVQLGARTRWPGSGAACVELAALT